MIGTIYTISNPKNNKIFYVGATINPLSERLSAHSKKTPVGIHVRLSKIKRPLIEEVEKVRFKKVATLYKQESYWIEQFRQWGFALVNKYGYIPKMKPNVPYRSLKISESVHTKLKIHIAKTKGNMTAFADSAIEEKLKTSKS